VRKITWTHKCKDGVNRDIRVELHHQNIKWQFKRKDEETWDYDSVPTAMDWDELEDILRRRAGRGRGGNFMESLQKMRRKANV